MIEDPSINDASQTAGDLKTGDDYVVVARRYRPQAFGELIGQEHVARALGQAITTGRIGHAYLFTGARGVGKTSAARIFAKALNCTAADGPTPTPCGECDLCRSVAAGGDVDVLEIDGASNRGIDEIRQLRQNVAVRPSRARFKVYIIDEVHMLTKEAFNALLKTLEEPPEHVKFLFATTEPNKIPITILSRCQRLDFAGIEAASIQQRLAQIAEAEGVAIEPEALQTIALRAAGSMRDSQSLLEQLLAVADGQITSADVNDLLGVAPAARVSRLAELLVDHDAAAALAELDAALTGGADAGQLIDQLLGYFRDAMTLAVGGKPEQMLSILPAQGAGIAAVAERLGVQTVLAILQVLDQTAARLRVSVHARTLAEMAVVRIANLQDLDELAGIVAAMREGGAPPAARGGKPNAAKPAPPVPSETASRPGSLTEQLAQRTAQTTQPADPPTRPITQTEPPAEPPRAQEPAPAPAAAAELSDSEAQQVWEKAVSQVGGLLASFSARATADGGALLVRFDQAAPVQLCEQPAQRGELERAVEAVAGRRWALRFEAEAAPNTAPAAAPRRSRRQLMAEIEQQPFVQKAMELFNVEPGRMKYTPPAGG